MPVVRRATASDLPRINIVRHGTAENRLLDPTKVTSEEVQWYLDHADWVAQVQSGAYREWLSTNYTAR
jgi:hypothetical protein